MDQVLGYVLSCSTCARTFIICKSCYRGHRYCSEMCRKNGYARLRRKARQKFEKTIEARLDHRDRSQRYRNKLKSGAATVVTDQSSNVTTENINMHAHEKLALIRL